MSQRDPNNRALILQRALELFAARGYDAIGVQEICEAAGVTKPTLYHYFGSKHGLLQALVQERGAPLLSALGAAAVYQHDLPLNLQRTAWACFQFANREPAFYRLLLALWLAAPDNEAFQLVAAFNQQQQQLIEDMFAAAVPDHGNMRGRQRIYAATWLGTINTYVGLGLNGHLTLNEDLLPQIVQQFSHGIYS